MEKKTKQLMAQVEMRPPEPKRKRKQEEIKEELTDEVKLEATSSKSRPPVRAPPVEPPQMREASESRPRSRTPSGSQVVFETDVLVSTQVKGLRDF